MGWRRRGAVVVAWCEGGGMVVEVVEGCSGGGCPGRGMEVARSVVMVAREAGPLTAHQTQLKKKRSLIVLLL